MLGRQALIAGGSRGQGRARAHVRPGGAGVIIVDIAEQMSTVPSQMATPDDLDETVKEVEAYDRRALAIKADVRDQRQLDEAVSRGIAEFGKIDILIANAGIWTQAPFWELTDDQWEEMIGVNLTGVWKSAKAVATNMIERGSGSIVITYSTNGWETRKKYAHYVAAKHGVIGLMKNIALELAPYGVRCNSISPGAIKTPMTDHQGAWDMFARAPRRHRGGHAGGRLPLRRAQGHDVHGPAGHPPTRRYTSTPT
jgi:NAD(P)-dependent dehydrogenase (short-subunit alcohol dehydrogenase family)